MRTIWFGSNDLSFRQTESEYASISVWNSDYCFLLLLFSFISSLELLWSHVSCIFYEFGSDLVLKFVVNEAIWDKIVWSKE